MYPEILAIHRRMVIEAVSAIKRLHARQAQLRVYHQHLDQVSAIPMVFIFNFK